MTTLTAIGAPEDDGERPATVLPTPYYDPDNLHQRFMHEPIVTRRYESAPLALVVKDLVRTYGEPYDLSVGDIDAPFAPITADWQSRSLYECCNDLTNQTGLRWSIDEYRLRFGESRVQYHAYAHVYAGWAAQTTTGTTVNPTVWRLRFGP